MVLNTLPDEPSVPPESAPPEPEAEAEPEPAPAPRRKLVRRFVSRPPADESQTQAEGSSSGTPQAAMEEAKAPPVPEAAGEPMAVDAPSEEPVRPRKVGQRVHLYCTLVFRTKHIIAD